MRKTNRSVAEKVQALRKDIARECGARSVAAGALLGPLMLWLTKREERRLERGVTYEPEMFVERRNWVKA